MVLKGFISTKCGQLGYELDMLVGIVAVPYQSQYSISSPHSKWIYSHRHQGWTYKPMGSLHITHKLVDQLYLSTSQAPKIDYMAPSLIFLILPKFNYILFFCLNMT